MKKPDSKTIQHAAKLLATIDALGELCEGSTPVRYWSPDHTGRPSKSSLRDRGGKGKAARPSPGYADAGTDRK